MKNIILLMALVIGAMSCEKVIDIPLNEAEQKVVIEANCNNFEGESKILLSKSGSVYEESVFEKINDAVVMITDKNGIVTTFTEDGTSEGVYTHATFKTVEHQIYTLRVVVGEEIFSSVAITQSFTPLSVVFFQKEATSPFVQSDNDSVFSVFFGYTDNVDEENYYRARVTKNNWTSTNLYIVDDKLYNGEDYVQPFYSDAFDSGDEVFIELLSVDNGYYTYYFSKENSSNGSATPANPVTNIEGGALGYFGAYLSDTVRIVLP